MLNYSLRLILIGDCAVGKTAFATKLRFGSLIETMTQQSVLIIVLELYVLTQLP